MEYFFQNIDAVKEKRLSANDKNTTYRYGISAKVYNGTPEILYADVIHFADEKKKWQYGDIDDEGFAPESLAKVFDTKADMDAWLAVEENRKSLIVGANLYIRATDTPDYWWDGEQALPQEIEKQDASLIPYDPTKEQGQGTIGAKLNDLEARLATQEELQEADDWKIL